MCADRVHRILIAIVLGLVMGVAGAGMFKIAFLLQLFVMIMLIIWALTDFCPSLYVLRKVLPPCSENR